MNKFKFVVKNLQGKVIYKSKNTFSRADTALLKGNECKKNNTSLPVGSSIDVLPINLNK